MIRAVLESTAKTVQHRAVLVPSALATIGAALAFRALGAAALVADGHADRRSPRGLGWMPPTRARISRMAGV